jgi:hypothetical protein
MAWFEKKVSHPLAVATLDQVLSKKSKVDEELRRARIVLITSQEIDALGEGETIWLAREAMDQVLSKLARLVRKLRDVGCRTIVVTADHGYLFGEEVDDGMKIPPPGGQTADLHRRVWLGRGGTSDPAYLRTSLAALGESGDLDIAVPWGLGVFRVQGGAQAYFHGGMSPQEIAIPVMVLRPSGIAETALGAIRWTIKPGSKKISTRFFVVTIEGEAGLLEIAPPTVRVEVRAGNTTLSTPVSAAYGFDEATGNVRLALQEGNASAIQPDAVTLMINHVPSEKTVSVHLFDAVTGRELEHLDGVPISIQEY